MNIDFFYFERKSIFTSRNCRRAFQQPISTLFGVILRLKYI